MNKKHSAGLFFKFPIEINVMGDVVIDCSDNTDDYNFGICFDRYYSSSAGVVISGEGDGAKLTVKSGGVEESVGVQIDEGGCVVKNIELDVLSGNADKSSCAFFSPIPSILVSESSNPRFVCFLWWKPTENRCTSS